MEIRAKNLQKSYADKVAVKGIDIHIKPGEILGLLGPNGAGKSTTIKMLSGQIKPSGGEIEIDGEKVSSVPSKYRSKIGIMPQELIIWDDLTLIENLHYSATLQGMDQKSKREQVGYLMEALHMQKEANTIARNLSGGYKRRLNLANSIIHQPSLLFLDEPTPGIDAQSRRFLMDFVKDLGETDRYSIVLTDHYLDQAEKLSDYVVIIDAGEIVAEGTVAELKQKYGSGNFLAIDLDPAYLEDSDLKTKLQAEFQKTFGEVTVKKQAITALVKDPVAAIESSLSILNKNSLEALNITVKEPSLEDIFLLITGKAIRE